MASNSGKLLITYLLTDLITIIEEYNPEMALCEQLIAFINKKIINVYVMPNYTRVGVKHFEAISPGMKVISTITRPISMASTPISNNGLTTSSFVARIQTFIVEIIVTYYMLDRYEKPTSMALNITCNDMSRFDEIANIIAKLDACDNIGLIKFKTVGYKHLDLICCDTETLVYTEVLSSDPSKAGMTMKILLKRMYHCGIVSIGDKYSYYNFIGHTTYKSDFVWLNNNVK